MFFSFNINLFPHSTQYMLNIHCVKSARIRSYSGPYFPAFGMNTERYSVFLRIQFECGKTRTRITPNTDTFYAVIQSESSSRIFYFPANTTFKCLDYSENIKFWLVNEKKKWAINWKCAMNEKNVSELSKILEYYDQNLS